MILISRGRARCRLQLVRPSDKVHLFARREMNRLLKRCFGVALSARGGEFVLRLDSGQDARDGFGIRRAADGVEIYGNNSRSLLFAVYAFLKRYAGCRWFAPGEEIAPRLRDLRVDLPRPWTEQPTIPRRYIFPEGKLFSLSLMRRFIAWAPRNAIGDITISFNAWAQWRDVLAPEIEKRGLAVSLSGHCLKMLLPRESFKRHPEWFARIGTSRGGSGQYCFSNPSLRRALSRKLIDFLSGQRLVSRLSIWAEDTSLLCQCAACKKSGFLRSFAECIDEVAGAVHRRRPDVAVDFLAYNAGLAWNMLEPDARMKLSNCSTEIAYWGRDYRYGLKNSRLPADRRAQRCLLKWRNMTGGSLSLLEYYTDIWMLTHLIAPLPRRIAQDCKDYAAMGLDAVGPLICLAAQEIHQRPDLRDRLAPLTYPNLYFFATFAWNARQRPGAVLEDYARHRFGADAQLCLEYLRTMEKVLPAISSFNQSLFRLRFSGRLRSVGASPRGGVLRWRRAWSRAWPRSKRSAGGRSRTRTANAARGRRRWARCGDRH